MIVVELFGYWLARLLMGVPCAECGHTGVHHWSGDGGLGMEVPAMCESCNEAHMRLHPDEPARWFARHAYRAIGFCTWRMG